MSTYRLTGRITNREAKPLPGLTVRAYGQDTKSPDDFLDEAITNEDGSYTIRFTKAQFKPGGKENDGPDVYIRVFDGDEMLRESEVRRNIGQRPSISLRVDLPAPSAPQEPAFSVGGVVRHSDGRPLAGVVVRAAHKRLRTETPLGQESMTDAAGRYAITYKAAELGQREQERVNLIVRAFERGNEPLVESPVFFQTGASQTVDLVVKAAEEPRPLYERLRQQLDPLLDGAQLDELGEEEIRFLAGTSRIAEAEITRVVMAERAAELTEFPAAAFHGFLTARQDEHRGALESFWRRLAADFDIQPEDTARFRFLAQAGEIVGYEPALIEALRRQLDCETIFSALDLVLWDSDRWLALLESAWADERLPLPAWASGQTRDEQLRQAATMISRQATQVFPSQTISALLVSGHITTPNNRPAVEITVQAFHHDMDKAVPISARVLTNASGDYRLVVDPEVLKQRVPKLERLPLQLRIRAWLVDESSPVGQSEILPGARLPLKLNISLDREVGPTEYETVAKRIGFALDGAALERPSPEKLRWLAGATGLDVNAIQLYVNADTLARSEARIPAEAFYALSHPGVDRSDQPKEDTIEHRLRRAVDLGLVGQSVLEQAGALDDWAEQRKQAVRQREIADRVAELSEPAPPGRPSKPVDILRAVRLPKGAMDVFIRTLAEHPEDSAATRQRRLAEAGVPLRDRVAIGTALRLAELVGPNASLVGKLWEELPTPVKATDDDVGDVADEGAELLPLAPLAHRNADKWLEELQAHYPEQSRAELARQARAIQDRLEAIYPNEALLGRLEERLAAAADGPDLEGAVVDLQAIHRALDARPDINLRGQGLPFQDLGDTPTSVRPHLESLQRLSRIAPFAEAISLLEMGYRSAREIAIASEADFVDRVVDTTKRRPSEASSADEEFVRRKAKGVYRKAKNLMAEAMAVTTMVRPELIATDPAAINGGRPGVQDPGADLEKLFGAFDACSVEPCESVFGQPAYLVDMLELLNAAAGKGGPNPKTVLEERRPDIFHLELSCANAQTPLPAIDLVIELLEDTVAPLQRGSASMNEAQAWKKPVPSLSASLLKQPAQPATDSRPLYRQTSWSAEELLAHPEHLNPAAYSRLASSAVRDAAFFPWTLPFSLPHEEAEVYLDELQTSRADLLRRLRRVPSTDNQHLERASAELGLNPGMRRILLKQTGATQPWRFWGYAQTSAPSSDFDASEDWPAVVGADVKALLASTGLSYTDLIELLATNYINPGRTVEIEPAPGEDACELSRTQLSQANAAFLDRLHRFARLWMHLGCSVRELDRAIAIRTEAEIDAGLLIVLADARRVAARLKLPLADVLPIWADLDTQASIDHSAEPFKRQPSQYETLLLDKSRLSAADREKLALPLAPSASLDTLASLASAALGLSAADLALLRAPSPGWAIADAAIAASDPLPFLSAIYRWQTLSRATNLSIRDLLRLSALSGTDPFESPAATQRFLDAWETLRSLDYAVDDLDFDLRHVSTPDRLRRFDEQGIGLLRRVRDALLKRPQVLPGENAFAENDVEFALCQEVSQLSGLSIGAVKTVLRSLEVAEPEPKTALAALAQWLKSDPWDPQDPGSSARHAYFQLMKCAHLYARLGLNGQALQQEGAALLETLQLPRPDDLPVGVEVRSLEARQALFARWQQLANLSMLQRRLADRRLSFWSVREAVRLDGDRSSSWHSVAEQLGHAGVDVERLITGDFLQLGQPAGEAPPAEWRRFLDAIALVAQLGVAVSELGAWLRDAVSLETSAQIRLAAAAGQTPDEWRTRAPQLRHRLRQKQREALLAWVKHNHGATHIDELHTYFLIDPEMGPEQFTTRVAQATASVQAFVQRALLGKERAANGRPVALPDDFGETWEWMKGYRTWSNARKVFLYPENFLTPEVRDDKTPFFTELEQQLSQRALNEEAIEDALGQYLQKLDEVARLEIMGSCIEETKGEKILHIVGRTRSIPHSYYHRTWYMAGNDFTPWVKLDLDIDGDWVIPVVFRGRLTLYWVKHTKQIEGMADIVGLIPTRPFPLSPHYPMPQDQYSLSWSTRQRKGWTKKQIAERHIARPLNPLMPAQFSVRLDADRMRIAGVTLLPQPPLAPGSRAPDYHFLSSPSLFPKLSIPSIPTVPPPGMFNFLEFQAWLASVTNGVYRWGDWLWEKVGNTWEWVNKSAQTTLETGNENLQEAVKVVQNEVETALKMGANPLEVLQQILAHLDVIKTDIIDKIINLPGEVWGKFSSALADLPGIVWTEMATQLGDLAQNAWELLPESVQKILELIKKQLDWLVDTLTQPDIHGAPMRIMQGLIKGAGQFVSSIATVVGEFLRLVKDTGLTQILGSELVDDITDWLDNFRRNRPGWAGPVPGFEFGFFDVGEGGARALRLTPPPFGSESVLAAGGLAIGAAAASLAPLLLGLAPALLYAAPLLGMGLIAMSESARLIYSMFPGYPAFHDTPVLTGVLSTELPVMGGDANEDDRIRAWPSSGYFIWPDQYGHSYCSVAVNLQKIASDEWSDFQSLFESEFAASAEHIIAKGDDLALLLNVAMRVIRPLPFGPYPGRLFNPAPTIISEDRHCRSFLLYQTIKDTEKGSFRTWQVMSLYHPLTSKLSHAFDRDGVAGLYAEGSRPNGTAWKFGEKPESQTVFPDTFLTISPWNSGHSVFPGPASMERLDLSQAGAYSIYNWELFFHIPLLIAGRLARQQSFADALTWYRQIFDPTVTKGDFPQRFWRFKQFHDDYADEQPYQRLIAWLRDLAEGTDDGERSDVVAAWRRDPFNPHRIAGMRAGAYARAVVMRTVETLVNWGDARFREGSWEAVNEATQLYLLAREILGPRPQLVPARHAQPLTYRQLANDQGRPSSGIDPFGNALLSIETALSPMAILEDDDSATPSPSGSSELTVLSGVSMLYFGVPANEQLLGFWDTIESRLLKIRSGLDFEGRARTLPLGRSLADTTMPGAQFSGQIAAQAQSGAMQVPSYRFQFMLQKAYEFVGEVKTFGAAVLTAAEKRDAEQLARLRTGHELTILQAMRQVRELQIIEAEHALAAVTQGREGARIRFNYYSKKEFMSTVEVVKEVLAGLSMGFSVAAGVGDATAAVLSAFPQTKLEGSGGTDASGKVAAESGGLNYGQVASAVARVFSALSSATQTGSSMAGTIAHYQRRQEDWDHQASLAENDLQQFEEQIAGAQTRLEIARRELENQEMQIANASDVSAYMQRKFSNEELYEWMLEQATMLHFQSYLLAVDVARKAEWSFRYECLQTKATFITFENWNDLSGALMAGERLQHDLRRMEQIYLEQNTREHEVTKHISLAQVDPVALVVLRQTGHCFVSLPEHLFDADHPGFYQRRIKSISLSIPSVVGPHTSVNCRLSLERSEIRLSPEIPAVDSGYPRNWDGVNGSEERFLDVQAGAASPGFVLSPEMTAMVTSGAQGDTGLFEQNLRDERYLPFEGAGASSLWQLELPKETNRFDLTTLSDVVIHMRYTARDGGGKLREAAWRETFSTGAPIRPDPADALLGQALPQVRMFSVRHDFPDAWHRWLHPVPDQTRLVLDLDVARSNFPYYPGDLQILLKSLRFVFVTAPAKSADGITAGLTFMPEGADIGIAADPAAATFAEDGQIASLAVCDYTPSDGSGLGRWQLVISASENTTTNADILEVNAVGGMIRLVKENMLDVIFLCSYDLASS